MHAWDNLLDSVPTYCEEDTLPAGNVVLHWSADVEMFEWRGVGIAG